MIQIKPYVLMLTVLLPAVFLPTPTRAELVLTISPISATTAELAINGELPLSFPNAAGYGGRRFFTLLGSPVFGGPPSAETQHNLSSVTMTLGPESLQTVHTRDNGEFRLQFTLDFGGYASTDLAAGGVTVDLIDQTWGTPGNAGQLRWGFVNDSAPDGTPELVVGQWSVLAVPEPSSAVLIGCGLSGFLLLQSRRSRRRALRS